MSHLRGTGHRGLTAIAVAVLLLGGVASAHPLTTPDCLAKKLRAWGNLRRCQAIETGEALQGRESRLSACQATFNNALARADAQATAVGVACRYGVNGDGTATDYDTGLQWEQKTSDGSMHDQNNGYRWNTVYGGSAPNGAVFTEFLGALNNGTSDDGTTTSGCFAGHCDWRLPAIGELDGIVDLSAPGCGISTACIDQSVFGPTVFSDAPDGHPHDPYWSATTDSRNPASVWEVDFSDGSVYADGKDDGLSVRAVRQAW